MKYVAFIFFLIVSSVFLLSQKVFSSSAEIHNLGGTGDISVSTSQWTAIPATGTANISRIGLFVDSYNTNTANFLVNFTTNSLPPGSTSQGLTMKPSDSPWTLSMDYTISVWAISLHTVAERMFYKELRGN